MACDRTTVEEMVASMLDCPVLQQGDYSSSELSSACFTITLRVIQSVMAQSPDPTIRATMRQAVGTLLIACADAGRPN